MARTSAVEIDNLGGGVNDYLRKNEIGPSQTPSTARNIRIDGKSKRPRKGYSTFANVITGGTSVQGLSVYRRDSATNDKIVIAYNTSLYSINPLTDNAWGGKISGSPAFLTGDTGAQSNPATWAAVTDGSFRLTLNGVAYNVDGINFTADTTMQLVATTIESKLRIATGDTKATVVWSTNRFIITSGVYTTGSAITVLSTSTGTVGTDISGAGASDWMDADITNGVVTNFATLITSNTRTNFANYKDWLFVFNGIDKPIRLTGEVASIPFTKPDSITATDDFLPLFGEVYFNSLWVSGVSSTPNTLFISKPATTANPQDVYDFSGTLATGAADEIKLSSRITATRNTGNSMAIFTIDSAYYVDGFKDLGVKVVPNINPIAGASGAINQSSTVAVENDVFYLTPQKEIKSLRRDINGGVVNATLQISKEVKNFLQDNLDNDQSSAFAYYDQAQKLYKLFVKSIGATFNDIRIIADMRQLDQNGTPQWLIDNAMAFNAGCFYIDKGYIGSSIIGQMYVDEDGLADDDSANIASYWSTKDLNANNPTTLKRFKEVAIYGLATSSTSLLTEIFVDDKIVQSVIIDSNDLSDIEEGGIAEDSVGSASIADDDIATELQEFVKRIPMRTTGKKIKIVFSTDGINQDYRISHIEYSFIAISKLFAPVSEKL
jgi:hypothetical protein